MKIKLKTLKIKGKVYFDGRDVLNLVKQSSIWYNFDKADIDHITDMELYLDKEEEDVNLRKPMP